MIRFVHLALIAVMFASSLGLAARADMYKGYETPDYEVERSEGEIELRRYRSHLVAEVAVSGDRDGAIGRGFRVLADYIFGGNATGAKVAMTSPVSQAPVDASGDTWTVRFMMPSAYTVATLPAPENAAIRFVQTQPERHLVIRFSGRWSDRALAQYETRLRDEAQRMGLMVAGAPTYHFYDGPFTLPWNRRNEVALAIR